MSKKTDIHTSVETGKFQAALGIVSKALGKSTLPVLATIHIETQQDAIALTATDLETSIRISTPASISKSWAACAPGATLTSLASAAPGEQVDLTWEEESATLQVRSLGTKAKLKSLTSDEFPHATASKTQKMGILPAAELRNALKRVVIAASADESRPALCAVQLALVDEQVYLAAADGFRLAVNHLDHEIIFPGKASLLIPRSAVIKLAAILPDDNLPVSISVLDDDRALLFTWDTVTFRVQLADFNFPNWTTIFPTEFKHDLHLKSKTFQDAVRRAEIFARESNKVLKLAPDENGMRVYGEASETGRGETILDDAVMPILIGFNVTFIRQGLDAIGADQVRMRLNAANAPALFTNGSDKFRYLVMPVMTGEEAIKAADVAQAAEAG
jgi:DNA polymerase-3 subunit beta